jgi:integrase
MKLTSGGKRRPGSIAVGGERAAAQCVALVSSIYAFAIGRGVCVDNPARGVEKAPARKLERFLSDAEIARLGEALDVEAQKSGNPYPSAAIRLLLLTGCRKSEITTLQWDHVDLERGMPTAPGQQDRRKGCLSECTRSPNASRTSAHGAQPTSDLGHAG